jgi:NADPH:quinone reductase-like Zn-dependent oxidoreductase
VRAVRFHAYGDPEVLRLDEIEEPRPAVGEGVCDLAVGGRVAFVDAAGGYSERVASGELEVAIDRIHPLSEAAEAHRRLESRATSGKLLLAVA